MVLGGKMHDRQEKEFQSAISSSAAYKPLGTTEKDHFTTPTAQTYTQQHNGSHSSSQRPNHQPQRPKQVCFGHYAPERSNPQKPTQGHYTTEGNTTENAHTKATSETKHTGCSTTTTTTTS